MKLYLIRHGDPNYKDNCLTPLGHLQAEALAERIEKSTLRPDAIYSSKYGRAYETAEHTANKLGMDITVLDFMHEITTGCPEDTPEQKLAHSPWHGCGKDVLAGTNLASFDWQKSDVYEGTRFPEHYERISEGFKSWISEQGFEPEGLAYRCTKKNKQKVLIFSHGGTISCLLADILHTNPLHICNYFRLKCTSITRIDFPAKEGEIIMPTIDCIGDHSHMDDIVYTEAEN